MGSGGFGKPAFWLGLAVGAVVGFFGYRCMEKKRMECEDPYAAAIIKGEDDTLLDAIGAGWDKKSI